MAAVFLKASHPTWVRGLKLNAVISASKEAKSHPTWVRGLKPLLRRGCNRREGVAPYVGAWIETYQPSILSSRHNVAPYVGAWIETEIHNNIITKCIVAPYVGAWIETKD